MSTDSPKGRLSELQMLLISDTEAELWQLFAQRHTYSDVAAVLTHFARQFVQSEIGAQTDQRGPKGSATSADCSDAEAVTAKADPRQFSDDKRKTPRTDRFKIAVPAHLHADAWVSRLRDSHEQLERELNAARSETRDIDLGAYINGAGIGANDAPHVVVAKLQAAISKADSRRTDEAV